MIQKLIIFTGNIGCGKSATAAQLAKQGYVIINQDAIVSMIGGGDYNLYDEKKKPIYKRIIWNALNEALDLGFSVVIDNTNMKRKTREKYIEIGNDYSVRIVSYDWGPGIACGFTRRVLDNKGYKGNWSRVYNILKNQYERPEQEEGFHLIFRQK